MRAGDEDCASRREEVIGEESIVRTEDGKGGMIGQGEGEECVGRMEKMESIRGRFGWRGDLGGVGSVRRGGGGWR